MSSITRVGVVGAGLMGSGIAEICLRVGLDVVVKEIGEDAASGGRTRSSTHSTGACREASSPRRNATPRSVG
jgi:3-hydroxybutyryl-CoA dehydrogenase